MKKLTHKMLTMLRACALAPTSPWDHGAGVVGALKKRGLIVGSQIHGTMRYTLTDEGRAVLALEGAS